MAQDNAQIVREGIAALNEAYARDDIAPWRRHVERWIDAEGVLEGGTDVFTEGEWRGPRGLWKPEAEQPRATKGVQKLPRD